MTQEPTWDETIDRAVCALSEAAEAKVDRKAVAEKIESAVSYAQFGLHVRTCPAARSDTRELFKRALKQVQKLRGTLKSIGGKEHRDVFVSTQSDAYAELPTIYKEVNAINEQLPQETRQDFPAIPLDVAARDLERIDRELKRFEERWGLVVNALDDMKDRDGRPRKEWKTRLILELATIYEGFVGEKPPRSDRGPFVDLCKAVFEFLEPPPEKRHLAVGDTVKTALMQSTELVGN